MSIIRSRCIWMSQLMSHVHSLLLSRHRECGRVTWRTWVWRDQRGEREVCWRRWNADDSLSLELKSKDRREHWENIFQAWFSTINKQVCGVILESGSCTNASSTVVAEKLNDQGEMGVIWATSYSIFYFKLMKMKLCMILFLWKQIIFF